MRITFQISMLLIVAISIGCSGGTANSGASTTTGVPSRSSTSETTGSSTSTTTAPAQSASSRTQPTGNKTAGSTDLPTRKPIATFLKPEGFADPMAVSADGEFILFPQFNPASSKALLRLISVSDGKTVWENNELDGPDNAAFDPKGRHVFVWCSGTRQQAMMGGQVPSFMLDMKTGKVSKEIPVERHVLSSGDNLPHHLQHTGDKILLLNGPGITVIDAAEGKVVAEKKWDWKIPAEVEPGMIVIGGGDAADVSLHSGSASRMVIIINQHSAAMWDINQDQPEVLFKNTKFEQFGSWRGGLAILPDGKRRLSKVNGEWSVSNMDASNPTRLDVWSDSSSLLLGLIPNSNNVMFRTRKNGLSVYSLDSGKPLFTLTGKPKEKKRSFFARFFISADGKRCFGWRKEEDGKAYYSVWSLE